MANKNFRVKHGLEVAGSATVEADLTVTGNLTVNGTTTTLNTETLLIEDNIVVLNSNVTGTPSTNAGIEIERGDSTNSALTWTEADDKWYQNRGGVSTVIPVSTSELVEGTNEYFTTTKARDSVSGGTGVTYTAGTGVIAIGQSVATTADVTFNTVNANITDDNFILGQIVATRNSAYVPPVSALTTLAGQNGIIVVSSSGGLGYGANIAIRYHSGDTTAGVANSSGLAMSGSSGTSTAPGGIATNQVMGSMNFDGYTAGTSNDYVSQIATTNQGAGTAGINPIQMQFYARQAFTNSITLATTVTGASGTGSVATLTFTTQNTSPYTVGQSVTIAGMTPSGYNGTFVLTAVTTSSISYANATTGFTSGGTIKAANTVTSGGTGYRIRAYANSTALTPGNRFNFVDHTASAATYKSDAYTFANSVITGSTLTATNYMTLGATTGSINQDTFTIKNSAGTTTYANFVSGSATITTGGSTELIRTATTSGGNPTLLLKRQSTATTAPINGDGTGLRVSVAGSNATGYGIGFFNYNYQTVASGSDHEFVLALAKGDQTTGVVDAVNTIKSKATATSIYAGTAGAAGATSEVATFTPTGLAVTGDISATGRIVDYDKVYGNFYSSVDQLNPVANAENLMVFGTTDIASDVSIVSNGTALTRITIAKAGIYNIQFSAQLSQTSGGSANTFIWLKKNGTTVADTAGDTQVAGNGDKIMASWNYLVSAAANDYFELAWAASATSAILDAIAASGVVPAIPSVILTVVPVGA